MANRTFYPAYSYGSGRVYCEALITLAGAATSVALTSVDGCDIIASITHVAATNKWTVTLKDAFNKVIAHSIDIREAVANGAGNYATIGNFTNEGTATPLTFSIYTWNAAGTARNDSTETLSMSLALRNGNRGTK